MATLWGAVVAHVPFVDVLHTMLDASLLLTPIEWPEWGDPIRDEAAFATIRGSGQIEFGALISSIGANLCLMSVAQRLSDTRRPDVVLTPRMEEVRQLLRQGMSNKRIASHLGLSEGTVKNYMSEIFRALNVSNRTQAAQMDADTL